MDSDASLFEAWCEGDAQAGETLFRRRVGEISRFFRNKVANDDDAADLVSQTFLAITQSRGRFAAEASFRRYVFGIAQNVLSSYIRTRTKRAREAVDFATVCIAELDPLTPSSLMRRKSGAHAFVQALRDLSLRDQIILELRAFEELSGRQIAEILAIPEGTVRASIFRATKRLRTAVAVRLKEGSPEYSGADPSVEDLEAWSAEVRIALGRDPRPM